MVLQPRRSPRLQTGSKPRPTAEPPCLFPTAHPAWAVGPRPLEVPVWYYRVHPIAPLPGDQVYPVSVKLVRQPMSRNGSLIFVG